MKWGSFFQKRIRTARESIIGGYYRLEARTTKIETNARLNLVSGGLTTDSIVASYDTSHNTQLKPTRLGNKTFAIKTERVL